MATELPLHDRHGSVRAVALVDDADAALVSGSSWSLNAKTGYVAARIGGRKTYLHRLIMGLTPGDGREVDHRDGNTLDNRRVNLRVASHAENGQNLRTTRGRARGVSWHPASGLWRARATKAGREVCRYFRRFEDAEVAAREIRASLFTHAEGR